MNRDVLDALGVIVAPPDLWVPLRADDRETIRAWARMSMEDWEAIDSRRWSLGAGGYASAGRSVLLHRVILGLEKGDPREGDHINGDRLDNRRENLRIVTSAENHQNVATRARHRGVSWRPRRGCWEARGWKNGRNVFLGHFKSEEEAAQAAREWRAEHMPFANEDRSNGARVGRSPGSESA